jgi:hypothetical protein
MFSLLNCSRESTAPRREQDPGRLNDEMQSREEISRRLLLIVAPAAALAAADLAVKATIPVLPWYVHQRTGGWVVLSLVVLIAAIELAHVPSRAVAISAGIMSGGVIGNLVSASWNDGGVPNPLVVGSGAHTIAFNVADVCFLVGNAMLMASLMAVTIRNRNRLIPPRQWERALRRRLHR